MATNLTTASPKPAARPSVERVIGGLPWVIESPSYYRLHPTATRKGSCLDIAFIGNRSWCLFLDHKGEVKTMLFPSVKEAIGAVSKACLASG